jgi:thiol-disulfide isomerase/thioredoxin
VVQVNHGSDDATAREPYPIGLWVAVESADATPPFIRFSRRGFLVGSVTIGEAAVRIVLSDANNDAVYGAGDWWSILPEGASNDIAASRKVGDFGWADRSAFRLELEGTRGRVGRLVAFDPGLTPEEDVRARDRFWDDKHAERAEKPVLFEHDVEAAIADAAERHLPCFLDFETTWCGPCKNMDRWVYTAKRVVAAAAGVVCIKVDGDERKDLKEAHGVAAFPTGILFGPGGTEIARFQGYQGCTKMAAFFAKSR